MNIIVKDEQKDAVRALLNPDEQENFRNQYHYGTGRGNLKFSIAKWSDASIEKLRQFLQKLADAGDRSAKMAQTNVEKFQKIKLAPDGESVTRLEDLTETMRLYIEQGENHYLFQQTADNNLVPWFVVGIEYHEPHYRSGTPARVQINLSAVNTGRGRSRDENETDSFNLFTEDIRKKTMSKVLAAKGYYLETPELLAKYEKEVTTYLQHCDEDGYQMSVSGKCKMINGGWGQSWRSVEQSGRPAKMVMDPPERERGADSIHARFWDANEEVVWKLPIHPVFEMFDLGEHVDYRVHVNNTTPYVYEDTVDQKLVLPADLKDFLTVLIEHSKNRFKDIINGKEGGTIVLIEGFPGVGKTLSAEVYSEKMHRPLYKVQSSQLGTNPETVEKQLKEVLERAERWGAILLIDEADVYIRARGSDIKQNAIVGVFLRVLEYYRGVLFMTTNLGNTVDDAIVSRCTARFEFEMPDKDDQRKLWTIMSEQNEIGLTPNEINQIIKTMPELSGRDIKNLIKLAVIYSASTGERVSPKTIKFVSRFKQSGKAKVVED